MSTHGLMGAFKKKNATCMSGQSNNGNKGRGGTAIGSASRLLSRERMQKQSLGLDLLASVQLGI